SHFLRHLRGNKIRRDLFQPQEVEIDAWEAYRIRAAKQEGFFYSGWHPHLTWLKDHRHAEYTSYNFDLPLLRPEGGSLKYFTVDVVVQMRRLSKKAFRDAVYSFIRLLSDSIREMRNEDFDLKGEFECIRELLNMPRDTNDLIDKLRLIRFDLKIYPNFFFLQK
ncbi:MAG: hypothetical protein AAFR59_03845, partial [Bacteroidota bacterium]